MTPSSAYAWRDPLIVLVARSRPDRRWTAAALAVTALAHFACALALARMHVERPAPSHEIATEMIPIDVPPEERAREEPPETAPSSPSPSPQPKQAPKSAPAAQAAAVLTRTADPNEPVDLTGSFVIGSAATYAGGSTTREGTASRPASSGAPPSSTPGNGGGGAAPEPDRSRRPCLAGDLEWDCPFPPEADADNVDRAVVTLRIDVDASAHVKSIAILSDPGHGFGREARRCASNKAWSPALDRIGRPIDGALTVNVRFDR